MKNERGDLDQQQEKESGVEPLCGGCDKLLQRAGFNNENNKIWRCENEKCGRKGAGVIDK